MFVLAVMMVGAIAGVAQASPVTLTDGASQVLIDPASDAGVYSWKVGGTDHLAQQWFWFRTNLSGWNAREYAINEIGTAAVFQPSPEYMQLTYTEPRFNIQVTYLVTNGGFADSDLAEIIRFTNTSGSPITLTLFQYSDFNLAGTVLDRQVEIFDGNAAYQTDNSNGGVLISETVVSGMPDLSEVGYATSTLTKLRDSYIDNLDGSTALTTPGDLTWSFEWADRVVQPGHSFIVSKDKALTTVVPEPAGLGLLGVALLGLRRRRRV